MDALRTREPQGRQRRFPTFRLWGRLLWKEWREGWPILLIGVLLPLLTLPMSKREGWEHSGFDYSVMGLVGILLVLWAADRARRVGMDRGAVRQALPVSPSTRWTFLYLVPLPVPVLVGMSLGIMIHAWRGDWLPIPVAMLIGILYLSSAFLLATMLTAVLSFIPAAILGVVWLFNGIDTERPDSGFSLYIKVIAACLLAVLAWDAFAAKQRYWAGRVVMVVLLLAALINPGSMQGSIAFPKKHQFSHQWGLKSPDHSGSVGFIMGNGKTLLFYRQRGQDVEVTREFQPDVQPLDFIDAGRVLIGQQFKGEAVVRLSVWNLQANRVSEHGQFAAEKDLLASSVEVDLSPDGHYLAIFKRAKKIDPDAYNVLVDLWTADLSRGRAVPVMMNIIPNDYNPQSPVSWAPDGLYLSAVGGSIRVDLKTLRGRYLTPADFRRTP